MEHTHRGLCWALNSSNKRSLLELFVRWQPHRVSVTSKKLDALVGTLMVRECFYLAERFTPEPVNTIELSV
jgi:hypothetical protein